MQLKEGEGLQQEQAKSVEEGIQMIKSKRKETEEQRSGELDYYEASQSDPKKEDLLRLQQCLTEETEKELFEFWTAGIPDSMKIDVVLGLLKDGEKDLVMRLDYFGYLDGIKENL